MRRAAIVSPLRTAVGKYLGGLQSFNAEDLGAIAIKALVKRTGIDPERIEEVVFAQGYPSGEAPCIGRWSLAHQAGRRSNSEADWVVLQVAAWAAEPSPGRSATLGSVERLLATA